MGSNFLLVGSNIGSSGVTYLQPSNLVFAGDSLTVGFPGPSPNSYPGQVGERLVTQVANLGVDGARTADVIATQIAIADALYNANQLNVFTLLVGRNDLAGSVPVSTVQANIVSIISGRKAKGYVTVISPITPSNYAGQPSAFQSDRTTLNNWILAGGSGADIVCNAGNDPLIQDTTNTFYYQSDQLHMTTAGYAVLAINFAAAIQSATGSAFAYSPIDPFGARMVGSFARDPRYRDFVSVYDFGCLSTASSATNTAAILAAIAAAIPLGLPVVFPEAAYKIQKTNLLTYNSSSLQNPIALLSRAVDKNSNGHGTRLICDGSGASWLKAALNCVAPNITNTGPDFSKQLHGLRMEGIYTDQGSGLGLGSLAGFWLAQVWDMTVQDCGVIAPPGGSSWSSGITTWSCAQGVINRFRAYNCASGIALNGGTSDTMPGPTSEMLIMQPDCESCSSAGIAFQFAQQCKVIGGYLVGNAVGAYGNGPENSMESVFFSGNTIDVDMLTATAPYGGSVKPDKMKFTDCTFSHAVNIRNSTGTTFIGNNWDAGSSLLIDSNCVQTTLFQHNTFPATFTDNGSLTFLSSIAISPSSPLGGPGMSGQIWYNKTSGNYYLCTVSGGSGVAVWTLISGGGGVTTLNTLAGALAISAGTGIGISLPGGGVILVTNNGVVSLSAGAGIGLSASSGAVTITNTGSSPGAWTAYSPTAVDGGGVATITINSSLCAYSINGKTMNFRIYVNVSISGGNASNIRFSLPTAPVIGGSFGVQSAPAQVLQGGSAEPAFCVIGNDLKVGVALTGGISFSNGATYDMWVENTIQIQ